MVTGRFRIVILSLQFLLIVGVIAVPHRGHGAQHSALFQRHHTDVADGLRRNDTCPTPQGPTEWWLDYSVKNKHGDESVTCPALTWDPARNLAKREDFTCDESNPCSNGACCGTSGYCGYGETYCGNGITPNDDCWSNCDAHAECGKDALKVNATCPLNVCCSQYGFCGVTEDFCTVGFQSNCEQPDSGSSGSDAQSRIVAYWESWNTGSACASCNVGMKSMPAGSLTHLIMAFAYITPGSFEITTMDGVDISIMNSFTKVKEDNPGIKLMVSLGGWTFNDNNTDTQPVYTTMISSDANRLKFIKNLLSFLMEYGLDGVDFDWEYPGAGDRGGNDDDGANYVLLLSDLQDRMDADGKDYVVSFTTPSSYYYLQHFELEKMMEYADFTNLMAYDLHGTWDSPDDQIGSIVLAHTNLTEINAALDLFWRNSINPSKINLGIGFYGRSFQLSDPACSQPGCPFKGGADEGSCTQQAGILSYREIMAIKDKFDVTPYWDKTNAVKYMTWNSDQWVSYDDYDTLQQKVEYAKGQGLGGFAIWAIDLDTDEFEALQGLLYPNSLNAFYSQNTNADYWQDSTGGQCKLTDCGKTCGTGYIKVEEQYCQVAIGSVKKSQLCCPLDSAPDPSTCTWRGNWPYCNGECHAGEVAMEQNKWGSIASYDDGTGAKCSDGNYVYCCAVPEAKSTGCRVTDCGGTCNSDEVEPDNAGTFFDNCALHPKRICCPIDNGLTDCHWQGKAGSCYDSVCAFDTEIELAMSYDGGGENCGYQTSRTRVFCCTAPGGQQPFLPVDLEDLFPDPHTGDDVDSKYKLETDDTWGTGHEYGKDDPNDAAFGFFVMAAPETISTTLDKRDGSHWDLFDCFDAVTEGEHTIRMFCNGEWEDSNCHKLFLGSGAPGTILEMPRGCGPGRYAVAKDVQVSKNQSLPDGLRRRSKVKSPTVFDLTFDYDFRRVPRDQGDVQWRLDYSNEEGYWDSVVEGAGDKRRKRSLDDMGGSHVRWLEEAWREDHKHGLVSRSELHARWFGSDVLDWLKRMFAVVKVEPTFSHSVNEDLNVVLLQETYDCNYGGVQVDAHLTAQARLAVLIDTIFGLTIIAKLGDGVDLSDSYLYFKNKGKIVATFTLDALVQASYATGDIELLGLESFGATFSIPGILTVGPNFRIFGNVNMDVSMSGKLQAEVVLADWDTHMAFPDQEDEAVPQSDNADPDRDGTEALGSTSLNWTIAASGQITAHVKPMVSFGINFNSKFIDIDPCEIDLVADGWMQYYADGSIDNSGDYSVCYGCNSGASLYAQVQIPSQFASWGLPKGSTYPIYSPDPVALIHRTCPIQSRSLDTMVDQDRVTEVKHRSFHHEILLPGEHVHELKPSRRDTHDLSTKRDTHTVGPLLRLPFALSCPSSVDDETGGGNISTCPICDDMSAEEGELYTRADDGGSCSAIPNSGEVRCTEAEILNAPEDSDLTSRSARFALRALLGNNATENYSSLDKRVSSKDVIWRWNGVPYDVQFGDYPPCGEAAMGGKVSKWFGEPQNAASCAPTVTKINKGDRLATKTGAWVTEHVFEAQIVAQFWTWLASGNDVIPLHIRPTYEWVTNVLVGIDTSVPTWMMKDKSFFYNENEYSIQTAIQAGFGGSDNPEDLALASEAINTAKNTWFSGGNPNIVDTTARGVRKLIRDGASAFQYLAHDNGNPSAHIWNKFLRVSNYIDVVFWEFDQTYTWNSQSFNAMEPKRTDGQNPSLRSLWAYYLQLKLSTIEATAAAWCGRAKTYYNTYHEPKLAADKAWFQLAFGANGFCTAANMRFPRVIGGFDVWGTIGNPQFMTDFGGEPITPGFPTRFW